VVLVRALIDVFQGGPASREPLSQYKAAAGEYCQGKNGRGPASKFGRRKGDDHSRAVRQLLGWWESELAAHVGISGRDIRDFESDDLRGMKIETEAISQILEAVGVEFVPESGAGASVRLRKPRRASGTEKLRRELGLRGNAPLECREAGPMRTDSEKRLAMAEALVADRIEEVFRLRILLSGFGRDGFEDAAGRTSAFLVTVEEPLRLNVQELDRIKGESSKSQHEN
jgi:hypothetical protein